MGLIGFVSYSKYKIKEDERIEQILMKTEMLSKQFGQIIFCFESTAGQKYNTNRIIYVLDSAATH